MTMHPRFRSRKLMPRRVVLRCPYCGTVQHHPAGVAPRCRQCLERGRSVELAPKRQED